MGREGYGHASDQRIEPATMQYHYRTRGTHNNIIDINRVAIMASIITSLNTNGGILQ